MKKQLLRQEYILKRKHMISFLSDNPEKKQEIYSKIAYNVDILLPKLIHSNKACKIALFFPLKNEIDILTITDKAYIDRSSLLFPRANEEDGFLYFFQCDYKNKALFEKSSLKIKEPKEDLFPYDKSVIPNIVFTPLLAFDKHNNRIGYGKGFYDKTFWEYHRKRYSFISIGVSLEDLYIQDEDVFSAYDYKLDYIISEKMIYERN